MTEPCARPMRQPTEPPGVKRSLLLCEPRHRCHRLASPSVCTARRRRQESVSPLCVDTAGHTHHQISPPPLLLAPRSIFYASFLLHLQSSLQGRCRCSPSALHQHDLAMLLDSSVKEVVEVEEGEASGRILGGEEQQDVQHCSGDGEKGEEKRQKLRILLLRPSCHSSLPLLPRCSSCSSSASPIALLLQDSLEDVLAQGEINSHPRAVLPPPLSSLHTSRSSFLYS
mmetsp:Transcript_52278/g.162305  ORF Transcript_52278/g.162305 Transcript_52278/m.162305 type:complete len:227 (-) Transcript_52278:1138-1818(-)